MARIGLDFLGFLPVALACAAPTTVSIRSNASWSTDGTSILLVETRYETTEPESAWFFSPNATHWRTVFLQADPDLTNARELATFEERNVAQGGGIQAAPLFWLAPQQVVVGLVDHAARAFDVGTKTTRDYVLPDAERLRLFKRPLIDLGENAGPVAVVPSPDATRVAVFHTATYLGAGGFTDMRFVHAIAIHALDGTFERAIALTAWDDSEEDLNLDLPPPVPMLPNPEPGEGFAAWGFVPAHYNTRMLWTKDATGLFVIDVDRDNDAPTTALAWRIDVATGVHTEATDVPARAVPTRGGGVSPTGQLLATFRTEGEPNADELRLFALTDWVPFDDLGTVAATDAGYAR